MKSGSGAAARCLSTLWYIDGMHDTLNERSCNIPTVFNQFSGYNKPENHDTGNVHVTPCQGRNYYHIIY